MSSVCHGGGTPGPPTARMAVRNRRVGQLVAFDCNRANVGESVGVRETLVTSRPEIDGDGGRSSFGEGWGPVTAGSR